MSLTVPNGRVFLCESRERPRASRTNFSRAAVAAKTSIYRPSSAVPFRLNHVELDSLPRSQRQPAAGAAKLGWGYHTGPQHAVLIQVDDHLGATADIHRCLREAEIVGIYASSGVTDGAGRSGYVIYLQGNRLPGSGESPHYRDVRPKV